MGGDAIGKPPFACEGRFMINNIMTIGEKIRLFRTLKKMSQKALAEHSGVSQSAIRKYEEGTRTPKPIQLKKIAQALNINFFSLLFSDQLADDELILILSLINDTFGFDIKLIENKYFLYIKHRSISIDNYLMNLAKQN